MEYVDLPGCLKHDDTKIDQLDKTIVNGINNLVAEYLNNLSR
jgi:hypothetical protein